MAITLSTPAGTNLDTNLGFQARAVIVDNLTSAWLYIPALGRYVPPYVHGWADNLQAVTQRAFAEWATPPTLTTGVINTAQSAQLTWSETPVAPSQGVPVQQPSTTQQLLATMSAVGGVAAFGKINIPPGMLAMRIVVGDGGNQTNRTITGVQTGVSYSGSLIPSLVQPVNNVVNMATLIDAQIDVTINTSGATNRVWLIAILVADYGIVDMVNVAGTFDQCDIRNWGGVGTTLGQKLMASSVPVTIAQDQQPGLPLLANYRSANTATDLADFVSIPFGRIWFGSLLVVGIAGAANTVVFIDTQGVSVTPAANTILAITYGPTGAGMPPAMVENIYVSSGANAATLRAHTAGAAAAMCVAVGQLLG